MLVRKILPHSNPGIILLDRRENDSFLENKMIFFIQFKKIKLCKYLKKLIAN